MDKLIYRSAVTLAKQIRAGELSSREVVEACLERIEEVNPKINAVVQLAAGRAREEADQLDRDAASGRLHGPLHGVPITLKDSLDTAGIVTTGGTLGRKDHVPQQDAPVVARLRNAGAVLLGKTNTPELTFSGETCNLIYGRSSNPFDLARSPGGSSGGAAAIIACGGSALELGSDTGGSVREPAHLCGVAGIKPTSGRTPRTGHIVPWGGVLDGLTQIGPIARYVEDLALALPIICGPDGQDPFAVPVKVRDPAKVDLGKLRIAWHADNGVVRAAEDIERVVGETAEALGKDGLNLCQDRLSNTRELVDLTARFRETTNAGYILRLLERYATTERSPELDGYLTDAAIAGGDRIEPALLEEIDAARSAALGFFADHDAILCPVSFALARPHRASHADSFEQWGYMQIYNLLGWPGVSVRAGSSAEGLPVGVQIVAPPWREDIALALAQRIEKLRGGFSEPPI